MAKNWRSKLGGYKGFGAVEIFIRAINFPTDKKLCWLWSGSVGQDGYGKFLRDSVRPHRFSYELFRGKIPPGMSICHACDTPLCVNPDHLWAGTVQQNMADRNKKGRQARQHRICPRSVSIEQALEMRRRMLLGETLQVIAKEFGVSKSQAGLIKARKTWHFRDEPE